jgi:hypothetical protein
MKRLTRLLIAAATAGAALSVLAFAAPLRPTAEVLRADLRTILARPEFREMHAAWLQELIMRWLQRLLQWWQDHVSGRLDRLLDVAPVLYWTIVAVLALVALAFIYHIYLTLRSAFGTGRRRRRRPEAPSRPTTISEPQRLLEQAEAAAAAGRFAEALRYLYLALIFQLDRHDILRYDLSYTNQEYVRQARRHPAIVAPLRDVSRLADGAWYGRRELGWSEYERCRELVQAAWQEADHGATL